MKDFFRARSSILAVVLLVIGVLGSLLAILGADRTFALWGVPVVKPYFLDIRVITHGAIAYRQGLDPMVDNVGDPYHRPLNYPRLWQILYRLGVDEHSTVPMGIAVLASFFLGVAVFPPARDRAIPAAMLVFLLSPLSLYILCYTNIDLFLFFLVSLAVAFRPRSPLVSVGILFLAFLLKLYPVFCFSILAGLPRRKILFYALFLGLVFSLYGWIYFDDLRLIARSTPNDILASYGIGVGWRIVTAIDAQIGEWVRIASYLIVFLLLWFSGSTWWRQQVPPSTATSYIHAFRAGASVYLGTFLLGCNYEYRMVFLLLVVPQSIAWCSSDSPFRWTARFSLLCLLFASWDFQLMRLLGDSLAGTLTRLAIFQLATWSLFAALLHQLLLSLPFTKKEIFNHTAKPASARLG